MYYFGIKRWSCDLYDIRRVLSLTYLQQKQKMKLPVYLYFFEDNCILAVVISHVNISKMTISWIWVTWAVVSPHICIYQNLKSAKKKGLKYIHFIRKKFPSVAFHLNHLFLFCCVYTLTT